MKLKTTILQSQSVLIISLIMISTSYAAPSYSLQKIIDIAMLENPSVRVVKAQQDAAIANVTTAKSYANPEIEMTSGPSRFRRGGGETKTNWIVGFSQPLEFSDVRAARREIAESNVAFVGVNVEINQIEIRAKVKQAFYDLLQRQAAMRLVEEDRKLLQQIRERVKLRVDVGESPKYELIKADTEALAVERDYQASVVRVVEAKAYLKGLVGYSMPVEYDVVGDLPMNQALPAVNSLREQLSQSPLLRQVRAASETADAKLRLEQNLRKPGVTIKAGVEQDPDITNYSLGLALPLPLWNQRQGQIAEALANISQVQALISDRELGLNRDLESSYQRYLIAQNQVASFESGLLAQSEAVLKVAESAYRYGERGILEYLDAQRVYRVVKRDYLAAKFDYVSAMLEIERLLGFELLQTN
ncbi:MAG: TolC family protein [Candidatus Methylopumilus sp.]|jgi:cobalt-zinc-cadmium efflux system outer membrane protein|nr:TolC family protein [Candidatus Methylopumilus sp.]